MVSRNRHTLSFFLSVLLFVLTDSYLFAQYDIQTKTDVSWKNGTISISATAAIPDSDTNITSARFTITEYIDRELTDIVLDAFSGIDLDSLHTLSEAFTMNMESLSDFDKMNMLKTHISSSLSTDLDAVTNLYKYDINKELIPLLLSHNKGNPVPVQLNYEPTANFSGIVIYAADKLPYYGEETYGYVSPAIFPKIFTENMDKVASADMSDPDSLEKWGFVQYTTDLDEKNFENRIGKYPLRTAAEGVFGNNRTDILIPAAAAGKILCSEKNRRLIQEGRILIIIAARPEE